jgi:hypothetical protein
MESDSEPNSAGLRFELLKPGEAVTVEFLWTGERAEPDVSERIADVELKKRGFLELQQPEGLNWGLVLWPATLGIGVVMAYALWVTRSEYIVGLVMGAVFTAITAFILNQVSQARKRNETISYGIWLLALIIFLLVACAGASFVLRLWS